MKKFLLLTTTAVALATLPFGFGQSNDSRPKLATGFLAGQAVGRTLLDGDGTIDTFGFFTSLEGLGNQLFSGAPSEKTAHFTYRASKARMVPIANLGIFQIGLTPASGDDVLYRVFFNANPNQDFNRPDSFSDGQVIATYKVRSASLTLIPGIVIQYSGSYEVSSSTEISFRETRFDLGKVSDAITVTITAPGVPALDLNRPGSIPYTASIVAVNK